METGAQYNSINSKIKTRKKNLFTSYDMMAMRNDVTTSRVMRMHKVLHSPCDVRLHVSLVHWYKCLYIIIWRIMYVYICPQYTNHQ